MNQDSDTDEKAYFWPIFFTVFGMQFVATLLGLILGNQDLFWVFIAGPAIVAIIISIVQGVKGHFCVAGAWVASAILAPLALFLVGVGVCFVAIANA
ncbi:hypothetical protein [Cerasicoccus frondis]|uniref:hypothetical protein n=1 Tax=Cerasicoccus frondis TaxID=490090 RepID=UPI002852DB00|nr:hypothetical protein [Cerasicoccus frondis]